MKRNNLPFPLDGVFIDSYATYFPDDQQQQEAFARETSKLWNFFSNKEKFVFKSIQDILDALYKCEKETSEDIEMLKMENQDRKIEIEFLTSENDIREGEINAVESDTLQLKTDLQALENDMDALTIAPIGSIMAWTPKPDGSANPQGLPHGWVRCDGRQIALSESPWYGKTVPNLNGEHRFLRGGGDSEVLTTQASDTKYVDYFFSPNSGGGCGVLNGASVVKYYGIDDGSGRHPDDPLCVRHKGYETRPDNMKVIWIIKVLM